MPNLGNVAFPNVLNDFKDFNDLKKGCNENFTIFAGKLVSTLH